MFFGSNISTVKSHTNYLFICWCDSFFIIFLFELEIWTISVKFSVDVGRVTKNLRKNKTQFKTKEY